MKGFSSLHLSLSSTYNRVGYRYRSIFAVQPTLSSFQNCLYIYSLWIMFLLKSYFSFINRCIESLHSFERSIKLINLFLSLFLVPWSCFNSKEITMLYLWISRRFSPFSVISIGTQFTESSLRNELFFHTRISLRKNWWVFGEVKSSPLFSRSPLNDRILLC